jgi:modulator of drug activity B
LALLDRGGIDVKVTHIDAGYDVAEEVAKFLWADVIIYQMPGWWMGAPWTVKKYIDECSPRPRQPVCQRWPYPLRRVAEVRQRRPDPRQAVHAVADLECTAASLRRPYDFFEAKGVDAVYFPFHKANQFLGMTACRPSCAWT